MAFLKAVPYQQQSKPSFRGYSATRIAACSKVGLNRCRRSGRFFRGLHCHSARSIGKVEFREGSCRLKCCTGFGVLRSLPRGLRARTVVCSATQCQCPLPPRAKDLFRALAVAATRMVNDFGRSPEILRSAPAAAVLLFSAYGLVPLMRLIWKSFLKKDRSWEKSQMKHVLVSYVRPLLFWMGTISICRAVDPIVLSSAASQVIKNRLVNFVRSLATVLAFAVCTTNLTQEVQRSVEKLDPDKARDVGVQFIGSAVSTSVWVAAACLFMELLGFSTQKLITAGGFGTVLVTLAGREILTNFLSSVMIHATRPFVENQWIQAKIEGQEISGTVEHVGWWSPTVIRGDDREAVHIPNHKFSVTVVRNLSQKTHWRIKTYLAISHFDVSKLNAIIADMRKVLAKQPQVEQKRLHRRVFLDHVDPETQALVVMVSCFVKTSRFEEYLRVKELILLDLLRVIGHHNGRLATPIRSVQRVSPDDMQPPPSYKYERPLLLPGSSVLSSKPSEVVNDSRQSSATTSVEETADNVETLDSVRNPMRKDEAAGPRTNDFDADDLVEKSSQSKPRKIFVQEHAEEQIVGSIMASGEKKAPSVSQDIIVLEGTREASSSRDKTS